MRNESLIRGIVWAGLLTALAVALVIAFTAVPGRARDQNLQQLSGMEASDFKFQMENYPPPYEAQVKTLLEGAKAQAQSAGQILITDAKLKTFSTNGVLEMLAESPKCLLDSVRKTVCSSNLLQVRSLDGKFYLEGEGFLLQQTNSHLIISNRVHTVLRFEPDQLPMP